MKEKYVNAEINIIDLSNSDIIVCSGCGSHCGYEGPDVPGEVG